MLTHQPHHFRLHVRLNPAVLIHQNLGFPRLRVVIQQHPAVLILVPW
ncbi:TPA: hypothetical protein ACWV6N_001815 [Salmonella enterica subsp. enterica serovar Muenchen]